MIKISCSIYSILYFIEHIIRIVNNSLIQKALYHYVSNQDSNYFRATQCLHIKFAFCEITSYISQTITKKLILFFNIILEMKKISFFP